jgi:hypothetical protein
LLILAAAIATVQASESAFFARHAWTDPNNNVAQPSAGTVPSGTFTAPAEYFTSTFHRSVYTSAFFSTNLEYKPAFTSTGTSWGFARVSFHGRRRWHGFHTGGLGFHRTSTFHRAAFQFTRTSHASTYSPGYYTVATNFFSASQFFARYTPLKTLDCPGIDCGGSSTCTEGIATTPRYTCDCAPGWYKTAMHNTACVERPAGWEITSGHSDCAVTTFSNGVQCVHDTHGTYDNNQQCEFRYTAGPSAATIYPTEFALQYSQYAGTNTNNNGNYGNIDHCSKDYLMYNGQKYCGAAGSAKAWPSQITMPAYSSTENAFTFKSDGARTDEGFMLCDGQRPAQVKGWKILSQTSSSTCMIKTLPNGASCIQTTTDDENINADYSSSEKCKFEYHGDATIFRSAWELEDRNLNSDSSGECNYDYLSVDGSKYCGNIGTDKEFPKKIDVSGSTAFEFYADESLEGKGFQICDASPTDAPAATGWAILSGGSTCKITADGCIQDQSGTYENNEECRFEYNGAATILRQEWNLEKGAQSLAADSCNYDYVSVDGNRYCGSNSYSKAFPAEMEISGRTQFEYVSEYAVVNTGFKFCVDHCANIDCGGGVQCVNGNNKYNCPCSTVDGWTGGGVKSI